MRSRYMLLLLIFLIPVASLYAQQVPRYQMYVERANAYVDVYGNSNNGTFYNTHYGYIPNADCANFGSQISNAGCIGLAEGSRITWGDPGQIGYTNPCHPDETTIYDSWGLSSSDFSVSNWPAYDYDKINGSVYFDYWYVFDQYDQFVWTDVLLEYCFHVDNLDGNGNYAWDVHPGDYWSGPIFDVIDFQTWGYIDDLWPWQVISGTFVVVHYWRFIGDEWRDTYEDPNGDGTGGHVMYIYELSGGVPQLAAHTTDKYPPNNLQDMSVWPYDPIPVWEAPNQPDTAHRISGVSFHIVIPGSPDDCGCRKW